MVRNAIKVFVIWAFGAILSSHSGVKRSAVTSAFAHKLTVAVPHIYPYHIYLTFDDGPSAGSRLVDSISRADSVDVNVFLVGMNASNSGARRQLLDGYRSNPFVELGNHSYTHAARRYAAYFARPELVLEDFKRNQDSLRLTNMLCRLPGRNVFRVGSMTRDEHPGEQAAADTLMHKGYSIFGWDIEWRTKPAPGIERHSAAEMFALIERMLADKKTFVSGNVILLVHDQELTTTNFANDVAELVRLVRADGRFAFGHLSEYK